LFGLAAKWKWRRPDPLDRLADSIEAIGERDRKLVDESARADRLRKEGAMALYALCRRFVAALNGKLAEPALLLDPPDYDAGNYQDDGPNLFQINLRGRLLQIEFAATEELYSTEEFRLPYVLEGAVRSFNQELLDRNTLDEQAIFYCPKEAAPRWYYFDYRTYGTGVVTADFLAAEMQHLL
jgi:hypothetical protein